MKLLRFLLIVAALGALAMPVAAHVPQFPDDNASPDSAVVVPDPVKSWSFYDELAAGQAKYYRVSLSPGERLFVGTFTPDGGQFTPSVVLMSPSLDGTDAPPGVVVPEGMRTDVVEGQRPAGANYEPFAPSASYRTVTVDRPVETERTYLVAVYEPANRTGKAGVVVGYTEEFSPTEYLTVPFDVVRTHRWEGQHPLVVLGPVVLTLLAGVGVLETRTRADWDRPVVRYALGAAGALVAGSGVNTAVQTVIALSKTGPTPAVLVTAVFVVVPLVCGGWVLRVALQDSFALGRRRRVGLVVSGVAALATWAGFIVGPAVVLVVAVVPRGLLET